MGDQRCDTLMRGTVVTMDGDRRAFLDGFVAVRGEQIVGVGLSDEAAAWQADEVMGGPTHLVLPGLVNVHAHLVQGCIRGMAENTTFMERLFGFYYPMTGACDGPRSRVSALPPLLDLVRRGVTTTIDDHFTHVHHDSIDGVLQAVREVGIRCRMARLTINDPDAVPDGFREDLDRGIAETERVKAAWEDDRISVTASTIGITYCEPSQLKALWTWTDDNDRQFDIHAPAVMDRQYLGQRRGWDGGSFEWLDSQGILAPNVIAAHAQNLRPGEADLIADRGVSIALVPDMEMVLGLVTFDASQFLDRGVRCGIGLDGPVVAYGHNLWTAARSYLVAQRVADQHRLRLSGEPMTFTGEEVLSGSAEQALELTTIGGAEALGMQDRIGSLEVGKQADVVMIDRAGQTHLSPPAALLANLVLGNGPDPSAVTSVMVGGDVIVRNGDHVRVDAEEAVARSDELQDTLLDEVDARRFVRPRTRFDWIGG